MAKIKLFILLGLMFCLNIAYSQDLNVVTWQECIDAANKYSPSLTASKKNTDISKYDYYLSWNNYYPSVNLRYAFNRTYEDTAQDNWGLSISASQTIFNLKSISDIKVKKSTVDKTIAELNKSFADIYYTIKEAYLKMQYAQENIKLLESIYALRTKSADIVRLQYEGGRESKGNMLRANAQKHSSYTDVENAKRDLQVAKRALVEITGYDFGQNFTVEGQLKIFDSLKDIDIDSEAMNMPQVIISKAAVDVAEYKVSYAKSDMLPNISASGSFGLTDVEAFFPENNRSWGVGVALNYPILSGGVTNLKNTIASAKTSLEKTREEYKNTILNAKTTLQSAQMSAARTFDNVSTYKLFVEASVQRQKEANIKYLAGTMEFQIWQDIEQELVNNQINYLSALHNYNLALAQKDKILGSTYGEIK